MIIADTHVHLYPCYALAQAMEAAFRNLNALAAEAEGAGSVAKVLMLTERADCQFFGSARRDLNCFKSAGYSPELIEARGQAAALRISKKDGDCLFIVPGRQIVTAERLEILGLGCDVQLPDGLGWPDVLRALSGQAAKAVLPWSPGKWLFSRGKTVSKILSDVSPGSLLIGDIALRPRLWPEPSLFKTALGKGFSLVAGSDPLPYPGQENLIGAYATLLGADLDINEPQKSLLKALSRPLQIVGQRCLPWTAALRLCANRGTR